MSEEIHNASTVVLGFGMMIAVLFCIGNVEAAVNTTYQYPFIEIFLQATNSFAGSAAMVAIILVIAISTAIEVLASASRMLWSYSRDRGTSGWERVSKVYKSAQAVVYTRSPWIGRPKVVISL